MSKTRSCLRRAVVLLLLLVIAAVAAGTAGTLIADRVYTGARPGADTCSARFVGEASGVIIRELTLHRGRILAIVLGIAVISFALLWLELRDVIRRQSRLVLSRGAMGMIAINLDQIGLLAQREAEYVSGVREVETATHSRKDGLDVQQTIAVEPEVAFGPLAERVQQKVKQSLEFHLGFPVARVEVLLRRASLRKNVI